MDTRAPGDLLDSRYELIERIGSGGMGTVFRARDTRLDRIVAVKLLHHGREVDDVTRSRLQAEARFAGGLQHPGIVQVYDYGEAPGEGGPTPYVVMQHVEGTPVSEVLRQRGPLDPATVATLLDELAQALAVAHASGIVHRDLKPSNILVTGTGRAVLVDFGVARSDTTEPLTETGQIIGSADYLSPEQVRGQRATAASDIYALGIVAHQCLSGTSPFRRETQAATLLARLNDDAPELGTDVPAPMRTLVGTMLSPEPGDRPTAAEVAQRVAMLDQQPTVVLPPMPAAVATPHRFFDRRRLVAIAAAAVLLLGVGTTLVVLNGDDATPPAGAAEELVVPSVRGDQVAAAAKELRAAGFDVVRRPVDGSAARGVVLRQSPGPGVYDGGEPATVVLRVSTGPAATAVTASASSSASAAAKSAPPATPVTHPHGKKPKKPKGPKGPAHPKGPKPGKHKP
ncbi:serine/threonine-protein kinase [Nocardioides conyzicola]|uniref:non-specific serine/threonine protein kinase n=1 Tax=Nocardioides conyzicola TaxID=1651781 RepID=A0ABP8WZP6_9ACTN